MHFKIIAVRPLANCKKSFLKVLTKEQVYYLYNNYSIEDNRIVEEKEEFVPSNLYKLRNGQQVSISAIVGKNGSGKSTIVELLYAAVYNAACAAGILEKDNDGKKIEPEKGIHVSIYYQKDKAYYCLTCKGEIVSIERQRGANAQFKPLQTSAQLKRAGLKSLFYSIAVNYSHHALNASHFKNSWLKQLFHKNDGYQTPLVINPFRDDGNININNEGHLTFSRLVTNLLTIRSDGNVLFNELVPGKKATQMRFRLNKQKINFDKSSANLKNALASNREAILDLVFKYFPINNLPKNYTTKNEYLDTAYTYIGKKLFSITTLYRPYQDRHYRFLEERSISNSNLKGDARKMEYRFDKNKLKNLLKKMSENPSHITFKFRQAINFINNISLYETKINKPVNITEFAKEINNIAKSNRQELITVIPPSFFNVDIKFENKGLLQSLSSGEKQNIYNATSWIYHLLNLKSVREDEAARYNRYDCINFIFDEIELYYHPEMQRNFINDFLSTLARIPLPDTTGINCIFITHSPFILSDIPNQNILFLTEKGIPNELAKDRRTFGANIHELLKNNFFLKDGSIGAFAQEKINSIIEYLSSERRVNIEWNQTTADNFINMISEPLIRASIRELYNKRFGQDKSEIRRQIELLRKELNQEENDSNR